METYRKLENKLPETVSVKEFAEAFNLNYRHQYTRIKEGKLPAIRIGRLYRIPISYVQELMGNKGE